MDENRKKIVVAEIENWRRNHLLPEHYCIFLLNLYTEGDHAGTPAGRSSHAGSAKAGVSTSSWVESAAATTGQPLFMGRGMDVAHQYETNASISWKMVLAWLLGACLIAAMILLAFHFNGFNTVMQIAIFASFSLIFYLMTYLFRNKAPVVTHVALLIFFLLLIFGGFFFIEKFGLPRSVILLYLAVISILWCIHGLIFSFTYLLYCGLLGLGLLYGYFMVDRLSEGYSWWMAELYWVPLALLLIGLGFLLNERKPQFAGVLAICGMVYFFGSEIASLYLPAAQHDIIQLLLFIKVFVSSGLFFLTRQYWFSWLRL